MFLADTAPAEAGVRRDTEIEKDCEDAEKVLLFFTVLLDN